MHMNSIYNVQKTEENYTAIVAKSTNASISNYT